MTKTPFEIRLDVLKLAKDMLENETKLKEAEYLAQIEALKTTNIGSVDSYIQQNRPQGYTTNDLITRSQQLYSFVTDKSTKQGN